MTSGVLFHYDAYQVTDIVLDKKVSPYKVVDTTYWFRLEMESNASWQVHKSR